MFLFAEATNAVWFSRPVAGILASRNQSLVFISAVQNMCGNIRSVTFPEDRQFLRSHFVRHWRF